MPLSVMNPPQKRLEYHYFFLSQMSQGSEESTLVDVNSLLF